MSFNFQYRLTMDILDGEGIFSEITDKVFEKIGRDEQSFLVSQVIDDCPFGIEHGEIGDLSKDVKEGIQVLTTDGTNMFREKVPRGAVKDNSEIIDLWKVGLINYDTLEDLRLTVISHPEVLKPGEVCSDRMIILGSFQEEEDAVNFQKFICTRLVRFLIGCSFSSYGINARKFEFVPIMDFTRLWTDEDLYEYFGIDACEQRFIRTFAHELHSDY